MNHQTNTQQIHEWVIRSKHMYKCPKMDQKWSSDTKHIAQQGSIKPNDIPERTQPRPNFKINHQTDTQDIKNESSNEQYMYKHAPKVMNWNQIPNIVARQPSTKPHPSPQNTKLHMRRHLQSVWRGMDPAAARKQKTDQQRRASKIRQSCWIINASEQATT